MSAPGPNATPPPRTRDDLRTLAVGFLQLLVVVGVPALFLYALFASDAVTKDPPGKTVTLTLAQSLIRVAPAKYCVGDEVTLIVVYPNDAEKGTFATVRTTGTLRTGFLTAPSKDVGVRVERGEGDVSVASIMSALANAHDVYLIADERCGSAT